MNDKFTRNISESVMPTLFTARYLMLSIALHLLIWTLVDEGNCNHLYSLPAGITVKDGMTVEYVVVGAGAAGSAAAARLALAGRDVLLVEAGGDPGLLTKIPSASMALLGSTYDWQYKTVPNNISCLSSQGRQCRFSRGKCLGGSTSINYMIYTRGNKQDYDDFNIPGWTWADLEKYFLRYEGLQILNQFPKSSRPFHNTTGIVKLEFFDHSGNPWQDRLVDGFKQLGLPFNADVNGASQIGVTRETGYVYKGVRMSTARAYLGDRVVKRKLKVTKHAYCTGVIIDNAKIARGVTVVQESTSKRIYARKEVTLCAGAVETPKILMLSGIGPADHLRSMGIKVISDLPVGENMSDHVLPLLIALVDGENMPVDLVRVSKQLGGLGKYLLTRGGPLASIGLVDINVFLNTSCYKRSTSDPRCSLPTLQVINAYIDKGLAAVAKTIVQHSTNLNDNVMDQISDINTKFALIIFSPIVLKPFSRGLIRLSSPRPLDPPAIFPNYLSDDRDVEEMLRSIGILEDLMETPVFKSQNASIFHLKFPGCPKYGESREGYWRCYVRQMTYSVFHAVGTCGLSSCVDAQLRVRGVRRLRVADASVLPALPRASTAAAAIAIGERVADFLLGH